MRSYDKTSYLILKRDPETFLDIQNLMLMPSNQWSLWLPNVRSTSRRFQLRVFINYKKYGQNNKAQTIHHVCNTQRWQSALMNYCCCRDLFKLNAQGAWWRHQMETFSALLDLCAGNSPVPGEFPAQRPVTQSFDVFCELRLDKQLNKQSWGWWIETRSRSWWRHRNGYRYWFISHMPSMSHVW